MRGVVGAVALTLGVLAQGAQAADMPFLRGALFDGPRRHVNWEGFYVGGQASYGRSDMNFTNATQGIVAKSLANTVIEHEFSVSTWPVLDKQSQHGQGYGGFVGYNAQWNDVVLSLEANYTHGNLRGSSSGSMGPLIFTSSSGSVHTITYQADAAMNVRDTGSVRGRAGWAFGSFLPYMFGGVSLGQADISRSATVSDNWHNAANTLSGNPVYRPSETQNAHFIYGYAGGLGVDAMLVGGLFLRAEWEYLKFASPINTNINTVRAGLGYKF